MVSLCVGTSGFSLVVSLCVGTSGFSLVVSLCVGTFAFCLWGLCADTSVGLFVTSVVCGVLVCWYVCGFVCDVFV